MNILFLDQFDDPGGAQLCLRDLMPEIDRRGWHSRLMTPAKGLPLRPQSSNRKAARDFPRYSVDVPRMIAAIRKIVSESQIDLVYINGPRVLPAAIGLPCPVIFHAHSRIEAAYARRLIAWSLRTANATVIAVSGFISQNYPRAKVIYNGIADLGFQPRTFDRKTARIGIIGRIAPEKGQLDFVRAARQIRDAEFFVYGEPLFADGRYDRAVREAARDAPIRFCGWTGDIAVALHDLDILAVPSGPNEAVTRVIPEAFSAGTPAVAYASGGIPEIVDHGRTGFLTESPDSDALALAINRLIGDPQSLQRLAAGARREWQSRFTIERFQTAVCDLIEDCATTNKRRARSAQSCAGGAATAGPVPTRPE